MEVSAAGADLAEEAASEVSVVAVPAVEELQVAGKHTDVLEQLIKKLDHALSGRMVSVILYGSAALPEADRFSDLNILAVLKDITPRELADSEPVLRWWRELGHPPLLLMTEQEVSRSTDSFPVEFHDMQRRRRVLFGTDPIADLHVENTHYRAQVEYQLRSGLLRLRRQGGPILSDGRALVALCLESVSTFSLLGRHLLLLAGVEAPAGRRALVEKLGKTLDISMRPLELLLDIGEEKPGAAAIDPSELFAEYLVCISKLIAFVDHKEKNLK